MEEFFLKKVSRDVKKAFPLATAKKGKKLTYRNLINVFHYRSEDMSLYVSRTKNLSWIIFTEKKITYPAKKSKLRDFLNFFPKDQKDSLILYAQKAPKVRINYSFLKFLNWTNHSEIMCFETIKVSWIFKFSFSIIKVSHQVIF